MFTTRDILCLIVLPILLTAGGGLAAFFLRKRGNWNWLIVLAMTVGMLAAGLTELPPKGTPKEAMDWLVLLPAMTLALSVASSFPPSWTGIVALLIQGTISTWLIAGFLPAGSVPSWQSALLATAPAILFAILAWPAQKRTAGSIPAVFSLLAISTVIVEMAGSFIQFGQYAVALPAIIGTVFLIQMIFRMKPNPRGFLIGAIGLWTTLLIFGHLWADIPPERTILLACAPLAVWGAEALPARISGFKRALAALLLIAIPLAFAVYPAAKDLYKLVKSQTQVEEY